MIFKKYRGEKSMNELDVSAEELDYIFSTVAVRERARAIFDRTLEGHGHFIYHDAKFSPAVDYVLSVIRKNYPTGAIPFHSRWGHFRAGGVDRAVQLTSRLKGVDAMEKARAQLDLVITSVLLDAGAGASWNYKEEPGQKSYSRSEGLGVASFHMFMSGAMSSDQKSLRADVEGLRKVTEQALRSHFQVSVENPLLGVEGRVGLLNQLAKALENKNFFKDGRPGNIIDYVADKYGKTIPATGLLRAVIDGLGSIWPGRLSARGMNLGDVWVHSQLPAGFESLVPFHKLSQWMTYSLIEPIEEAGFRVQGVENLTGLAEYRNGGLLLDSGLITLRNPTDADKKWRPDSDLIIEWRALTVDMLDRIGDEVQKSLGHNAEDFPLAKVLEGGTWWAGRFLAQEKRANGEPPLRIESDGTVF